VAMLIDAGVDVVAVDSALNVSGVDVTSSKVPNVKGMGLRDAIYTLNSMGFKIFTSGMGAVVEQVPAAGLAFAKGDSIKLVFK
ncbi:MAG: PASTA domain-containing protein, partial [Rikenellaceae bacterium]